jgi:hypothetical protein
MNESRIIEFPQQETAISPEILKARGEAVISNVLQNLKAYYKDDGQNGEVRKKISQHLEWLKECLDQTSQQGMELKDGSFYNSTEEKTYADASVPMDVKYGNIRLFITPSRGATMAELDAKHIPNSADIYQHQLGYNTKYVDIFPTRDSLVANVQKTLSGFSVHTIEQGSGQPPTKPHKPATPDKLAA